MAKKKPINYGATFGGSNEVTDKNKPPKGFEGIKENANQSQSELSDKKKSEKRELDKTNEK